MVNRLMAREDIGTLYFDCYRYQVEDLPDYNMVKAEEFAKKFPGRPIKNIAPVIAALRMQKDEDEIARPPGNQDHRRRAEIRDEESETGLHRVSGTG